MAKKAKKMTFFKKNVLVVKKKCIFWLPIGVFYGLVAKLGK